MTNAEAIYYLERIKNSYTPFLTEEENAIDMAISVLEKQEQKKPLTEADRIRAMPDEELAIILMRYTACHTCQLTKLCKPNPFKSCYEVNLDWLKQEVKDND